MTYRREVKKPKRIKQWGLEKRVKRLERMLFSAQRRNLTLYHRVYAFTKRRRGLHSRAVNRLREMIYNSDKFKKKFAHISRVLAVLLRRKRRTGEPTHFLAITRSEWQKLRGLLRYDWRKDALCHRGKVA